MLLTCILLPCVYVKLAYYIYIWHNALSSIYTSLTPKVEVSKIIKRKVYILLHEVCFISLISSVFTLKVLVYIEFASSYCEWCHVKSYNHIYKETEAINGIFRASIVFYLKACFKVLTCVFCQQNLFLYLKKIRSVFLSNNQGTPILPEHYKSCNIILYSQCCDYYVVM